MMENWYQKIGDIIILTIYVQPGAKHNEVVGIYDDALKIKLTSPPVEGRANKALLRYIATLFEVSLSQVRLKQGAKSRYKTITVHASLIAPETLLKKSKSNTVRVFFAIMLPESSHLPLAATLLTLKKSIPVASIVWNAVNNLHVTLQFLNGLQEKHTSALIDQVRSQLKNTAVFKLKLGHLEMFPSLEHPHIISLSVEPQAPLMGLSNTIGQAISALGYPVETRPFKGHITVARLHHYKPQAILLSQTPLPDIAEILIDKIYLVESKLDQQGPNYRILAQFDLG